MINSNYLFNTLWNKSHAVARKPRDATVNFDPKVCKTINSTNIDTITNCKLLIVFDAQFSHLLSISITGMFWMWAEINYLDVWRKECLHFDRTRYIISLAQLSLSVLVYTSLMYIQPIDWWNTAGSETSLVHAVSRCSSTEMWKKTNNSKSYIKF